MKVKKINLYLDNKNKQRFQEYDISEDEMKQVNNGFSIQENNMKNIKNVSYIILLKKINNERNGKTNIFNRTIFFYDKDREIAKKKIIGSFKEIMKGRSKESLQNLSFITEDNLKFVSSLLGEEKIEKKKGKK